MNTAGAFFRAILLVTMSFFLSLSMCWAQAEATKVLAIALPNKNKSIQKPASDLVKDGQILDVGDAAKLSENGFDLSELEPVENKMWQNQRYKTTDADGRSYPKGSIGVQYLSLEASTKFTSMARVESKEKPGTYFRLALSRYSQPMMMRAALLRKLGYFIPSPQYYKDIRVVFANEKEKEEFINNSQLDIGVDFESRKWITSNNVKDHSITLASATLESVSSEYFDLNWGLAPNPDDPNQVPLVQRFSRNRSYRTLIFPYALVDVPESVNRYSVRFASISTGFAAISYFMADSFAACTYDDAKWMLKRVATLTEKDLREVVNEGQYPPEVAELVYAKLLHRTRNALSIFQMNSSLPQPNLRVTSNAGIVKDGKVTQEFVAGYPQRFSHGERTSPYQEGDLARFLTLDGKTSAIQTVVDRLNKQLDFLSVTDAASAYQQEYYQRLLNHFRENPGQPFQREVTSWGGPLAGIRFNASRHISTGTFNGSSAPVQLVDNVSMGVSVGLFRALDGLDKVIPVAGGNVSVVRDYTHVRPLMTVKEGGTVEWKNLVVPRHMKNLAKILEATEKKHEDGSVQQSLDAFLLDLRDGEVFTITDSMALSAYIQASAGLDVLFGLQPFDFLNSLTVGADANRVITRQIQIVRVSGARQNGLQISIRELKNKGRGFEMNVNFFLNLLKLRSQSTTADILSEAFVIDYDPSLASQVDPETEIGKKLAKTRGDLRLALLPLFRDNDTELLYSKFKNNKFVVEHNLKAQEQKTKFLAWKFSNFEEDHLVKIQYPTSEAHPDLNPKDEEVTLFASKKGELKGRDLLGWLFELVDGVMINKGKNVKIATGIGDNPANAPLGKAYWRIVKTESDLSKNIEQLPSVASIQHVWGGWSLPRDKFFRVLDDVKKQFENTSISSYELINKNEFINVKSLDFYRITANLSVLPTGLDRLRDLLLQPDADAKNPKQSKYALENMIKKIRCKSPEDMQKEKCQKKIRYANDEEMFNDLMKLFGNGNYKEGLQSYSDLCTIEARRRPGKARYEDPDVNYKGTRYECLTNWMRRLISLAHAFPNDKQNQTRWMTQVLAILDEQIPLPQLLNYLGQENYVFLIRLNGFRAGDEDGDLEYFSNTVGDPEQDFSYAGGLINLYIKKTGLMPQELDRTLGGFQ